MLEKNFSNTELEEIYDALAEAIDRAVAIDRPEEISESILLTKLVLVLSNILGEKEQVLQAIQVAESDL